MASCPKCLGKLRRKSQKNKGGRTVYRCMSCKRKFVLNCETGRLEQSV